MSRLQQLQIRNFRGIRSLDIELDGKNCVVFGPNGCGKSSVADAIDFLLTGDLLRLGGEGALGLSVGKHGRHVDVAPVDSWVAATFRGPAPESAKVTLRRSVAAPGDIEIAGTIPADVLALIVAARTGSQHMLTRREVLRYIFTPPGRRMEQVSALLRLAKIDSLRLELQGAARESDRAWQRARDLASAHEESVFKCVSPKAKDVPDLFARVDAHRKTLGASSLPTRRTPVRDGVTAPLVASAHPLQGTQVKAQVEELRRWVTTGASAALDAVRTYGHEVQQKRKDETALKALRAAGLLAQGLTLATGNECPLCEREWVNEELRERLEGRLRAGAEAQASKRAMDTRRGELQRALTKRVTSMRSLAESLKNALADVGASLEKYFDDVERHAGALLVDPIQEALADDWEEGLDVLSTGAATGVLAAIDKAAANLPDLSGAQGAWDELTAIERALLEYRASKKQEIRAAKVANQLGMVAEQFVTSRDAVLAKTYEAISDSFTTLYRAVHGADEGKFDAELSPTSTGLRFEVDFYERGRHPPSALHSEGHQDSMGICLFLVLAEHLRDGAMPLIILDDVLTSVDIGHRRKMADLLGERFPDVQFVITTHDEVWYRQLQTAGVVKSNQCVVIQDWSIDAGPQVVGATRTLVARAEEALNAGDVRRSAHLLRTAVEAHFRDICESLGAELRYRGDLAYGSGEFTMAANSRLKSLVAKARRVAVSWSSDTAAMDNYEKQRVVTSQGLAGESWAVNPNIHYNEWAQMGKADFRPVLDAHRALFDLYICAKCETPYRVTYEDGVKETGLRCRCGEISWTLQGKS